MSKRTKTTASAHPRSLRRFTSDEHEERFENLIKRTIQPERFIRLSPGGTYRNLVSNFERRRWTKLCEPEAAINYDIVREFYANAMHLEEGIAFSYQTRVRGRIISFGRDAINSYLGNPLTLGENERCEYRTQKLANVWDLPTVSATLCLKGKTFDLNDQGLPKSWKRENLNLEARVFLVLLLNNIRPRSHNTTIPLDVGCLLYYIMIGKFVDVASIIAGEMRKMAISGTKFGGKAGVLAYPGLIMGLCRRANVAIPDEVHFSITSVINDAYLNRFCQSQMDRTEGAGTSSSRPRPRTTPVFDQMAFTNYCCESFETSRRSQSFIFDAM